MATLPRVATRRGVDMRDGGQRRTLASGSVPEHPTSWLGDPQPPPNNGICVGAGGLGVGGEGGGVRPDRLGFVPKHQKIEKRCGGNKLARYRKPSG